MPKKYLSCIKKVKKKIKSGKIPKNYKCGKKRCISNPYAICSKLRKNNYEKITRFSKPNWGEWYGENIFN